MDPVADIKARLPIEELVRGYTQLQKKGRNFMGLCPFHHDKRPSLLVSPDKGIAYCFPCQKGGDIFSFYQAAENVDFPQALRELAERTGVKLESGRMQIEKKDEKDRMRECLEAAAQWFRKQLAASSSASAYLEKRGVMLDERERFEIGLAPDGGSMLYDNLLKAGFSRKEIIGAGLAIQRELRDERVFDRFRGRIMFPIRDAQERIIGFGGRTLINDDAKYMNTPDGPLYRKSGVFYGLPLAREAMRETKSVIVVEGYFDLLACHRVGIHHVIATCGTALTEEHARILKRYVETVVLCLDADRAGRAAAARAFELLTREELQVHIVSLRDKDPADAAIADAPLLKQLLGDGGAPYVDAVLEELRRLDRSSPDSEREALGRLQAIYNALPTAAQRMALLRKSSPVIGIAESQLEADLQRFDPMTPAPIPTASALPGATIFSAAEVALGLFLLYPRCRQLLGELIAPEEPVASALYEALRAAPEGTEDVITAAVQLSTEVRERALILQLYCEEHGFGQWNESLALREVRRNCQYANRETLRRKQADITKRLLLARKEGKVADEELLRTQYQQLLKLAKMAI